MNIFFQILILIGVLATMIMVLLSIRQLAHFESFDNAKETSDLKEELEDDDMVLSDNNIFHNLVETKKQPEKVKDYIERDKDPFSRKE